ncbi:MAG: hypothetical protein FJ387_05225 [Verrucomicrobia bacterium]|nr:hypothetical protein [Verrucomicrobiota bacterium]
MPDFVAFGSAEYWVFLAFLVLARGLDFFSTWLATPSLVLEANPLARWLGWRWGLPLNGLVCLAFALWPLPAIIVGTTSVLVAARNLQSAWLMRTLGEDAYRSWMAQRLAEARRGLFVFCLVTQGALVASVGAVLVYFSFGETVPCGIGVGIIAYAVAVVLFTLLSVLRACRSG